MRMLAGCLSGLLLAPVLLGQTNLYVAADGSAPYTSVQAAIMAVSAGSREVPVEIHVAPGRYTELLYIQREKRYFRLIGRNPTNTILSFNLSAGITNAEGKPIGTFKTPSTTIDADDFIAENLTFENSAGPIGQALAIRVDGERALFRNCRFLGWQDTLFLNRGRQFFENCHIEGHVDFIFGGATAWFERCRIHCLRDGFITAASTPGDAPFGYVFNRCAITGEPGVKSYLGRPWRNFASTIFLNCDLAEVVRPEGWHDWNKPGAHQTVRYAEYRSTGAGGHSTMRPSWIRNLSAQEAGKITVASVLGATDGWNPTIPPLDPRVAPTQDNLEYGEVGGQKLVLDAHAPAENGQFPVVLIVHGGGWMGGDKTADIVPVIAPWAMNITWFSINYRLAPAHRWPACFEDLKTAIRWVKSHAAEFKGDPRRIALLGYSAGGQLVALAGSTAEADTKVQAIIALAPPTDLVADNERRGGLTPSMCGLFGWDSTNMTSPVRTVLRAHSPLTYAKPGLPPFLLVNGSADRTVPLEQTECYVTALKAVNVDATLMVVPGGQHRISDWSKGDPNWQQHVIDWLTEKLVAK